MAGFVIELYAPVWGWRDRSDAVNLELAAKSLQAEGVPIRYVRSIRLPQDEVCFHVVEAPSAALVRELSDRASIRFERISPIIETGASAPHQLRRPDEDR